MIYALLVVRARFHHGSLLCSVVVLDSLRSVDGSLRFDCLRSNQTRIGEVSLLDVESCIDRYATPTLGLNTYSLGGLSVGCYLDCEYTLRGLRASSTTQRRSSIRAGKVSPGLSV